MTALSDRSEAGEIIHKTRNSLNRISMQTELAKMLLESNAPQQKIDDALNKVLSSCEDCNQSLSDLDTHF